MKKLLVFLLACHLLVSADFSYAAKPALNGKCNLESQSWYVNGIRLVCTKSGSKFIWKKATLIGPIASRAEITFENSFQNRKYISYTAWKSTSDVIAKSTSKVGTIDLNTGPKTKPWFNDIPKAFSLVSRAFPNEKEASNVLVIRYNYSDLDWATKLLQSKVSPQTYSDMDRNEGGQLLSSNCNTNGTCRGSKALTTSDGLAILLIGVPNDPSMDLERYTSGQLEAHEYFHTLQDVPYVGKQLQNKDWPPRWFIEGSAEWIQNATVNNQSFTKYENFLRSDCNPMSNCSNLTEKAISDYLSQSSQGNGMSDFDQQYAYNLGSKICELLVSIAGNDLLIQMWNQEANGIGWDAAFLKVYGTEWNKAVPLIAKTLTANLQEGI
jgi:hypothetical protein